MGLARYKTKRNFKESPEPLGGTPEAEKFRFVIQKHAASHLHYDFRLEMDGVLKSWAVPKGPSTDPSIKRLAMMVEDHPYDYRNFEGIIPSGYGAGTVIVWDEGYYELPEQKSTDKKNVNKALLSGLSKGKLHIIIKGKKLKGEFGLIKTHGRGENSWLLFKVKDKYTSTDNILLKDKSVLSKKTLEQVAKTSANFHEKKTASLIPVKKAKSVTKKAAIKKPTVSASKKKRNVNTEVILAKTKNLKFPTKLTPMLATLVDKAFDKEGWTYEVKWDGYRAMGFINKGLVNLKSRNDKSFDEKFYPIHQVLKSWKINAIVDGEVVVLKKNGVSDFGALQNWRSEADGELLYYLFDIIWLNGKDLMPLPLSERREILKTIDLPSDSIRISDAFEGSGIEFFEAAKEMGLEGIIAKKSDSIYSAGARNSDWLKIKYNKRQEVVIGGYTKNDDSSKPFSSLLVGVYDKKKLIYTGKIGTGFSIQTQKNMMKQFKSLETKKAPFKNLPDINKPSRFRPDPPHATAVFLKPSLVCEVSFTEMTSDGLMRHPSFEGMRIDKPAKKISLETAASSEKITKTVKSKTLKKIVKPLTKNERKTLLNPTEETQVKKINGHELKFTNLSKVFWPDVNVTKRDLLNYYYQVAPYILPYLKDRPQSMNRHPNGIYGKSFYYKDVTGKAPDWIETYLYRSDFDNRDRNYLVAKDDASLLYMASLGCIEMNPWSSTVKKTDYPDWCVIDLDPGKTTFEQVIVAAQTTKKVLDELKVVSYPKTSGSKGIHIYIPLAAKYTYEQSKEFARVIAQLVNERLPDFTSIERIVKARKGKMYIDFLQNRPQATIAAPYSLRPKPEATVSMPLYWEEVKKGLKLSDFTIFNAMDRLRVEGDIFKPVLGKGINLLKIANSF